MVVVWGGNGSTHNHIFSVFLALICTDHTTHVKYTFETTGHTTEVTGVTRG